MNYLRKDYFDVIQTEEAEKILAEDTLASIPVWRLLCLKSSQDQNVTLDSVTE